jgi:hypothetical protein
VTNALGHNGRSVAPILASSARQDFEKWRGPYWI